MNIKKVIIFELTIPDEELIEEANDRNIDKYTYLKNLITESEWACELHTFEIGHRGFVAHSFTKMLTSLGVPMSTIRIAIQKVSHVVQRCSWAIFLARNSLEWRPHKDLGVEKLLK